MTSSATDADWIAAHLNGALTDLAAAPPAELAQLPDLTAARLASEFAHEAERAPIDKTEHPSASAVVVRACGAAIRSPLALHGWRERFMLKLDALGS